MRSCARIKSPRARATGSNRAPHFRDRAMRRAEFQFLPWVVMIAANLMPASHGATPIQTGDAPPTGEVKKYSFEQSKVFPGTVRDYWVYVPKQYDPARPACLYVNQDGLQYKAPEVFDQLIAKKEMPVTIG